MNLFRFVDGRVEAVTDLEAEFAYPDWQFGFSTYGFAADGSIVAVGPARRSGPAVPRSGRSPAPSATIDLPFTEMSSVVVDGDRVVLRAAAPDRPAAIVELDLGDRELDRAPAGDADAAPTAADIAIRRARRVPDDRRPDARTATSTRRRTGRSAARPGELPPLIVTSHGGPTAAAYTGLRRSSPSCSRAAASRSSTSTTAARTGYGKAYRKRLEGEWGVVDLDDCVAGARWLAEQGLVDGERLAIRGGSASGYTTLCAVTFRDAFTAGTQLLRDRRPRDVRERDPQVRVALRLRRWSGRGPRRSSSTTTARRSTSPTGSRARSSILQGAEDRVVPPAQAEQIVDALWEQHLPHAYLLFPGEDHGFRGRGEHHPLVRGRALVLRPGLRLRAGRRDRADRGRVPRRRPGQPRPEAWRPGDAAAPRHQRRRGRRPAPIRGEPDAGDRGRPDPARGRDGPGPRWPAGSGSRTRSCSSSAGSRSGSCRACRRSSSSPTIVFLLFLPPILFGAGYFTSLRDFKREPPGDHAAVRRARPVHDRRRRGRRRGARAGHGLGGGVRARGDRRPARRGGRDDGLPAARRASPRRHDPRGREPRQRRHGARRLPLRDHRRVDRHVLDRRTPASRSSPSPSAGSRSGC